MKDYVQYGFDIKEANANKEKGPNWIKRYRATELFGVKYISDYDGVLRFFVDIRNKKIKINDYLNAFFAYGPRYEKFVGDESKNFFLILI